MVTRTTVDHEHLGGQQRHGGGIVVGDLLGGWLVRRVSVVERAVRRALRRDGRLGELALSVGGAGRGRDIDTHQVNRGVPVGGDHPIGRDVGRLVGVLVTRLSEVDFAVVGLPGLGVGTTAGYHERDRGEHARRDRTDQEGV